jgi:hypothetical protein
LLKHWLFGEYGPFDRAVELAVLCAILYEVIAEIVRRRAEARHRQFIWQQTVALTQRLTKGERLHGGVPNTTYMNDQMRDRTNDAWIVDVRAWIADTNSLLASQSAKASREFMTLADAGHVELYIGNAPHGFYLRGNCAEWYRDLAIHLENLRRIISAPEAYFEHKRREQRSKKPSTGV